MNKDSILLQLCVFARKSLRIKTTKIIRNQRIGIVLQDGTTMIQIVVTLRNTTILPVVTIYRMNTFMSQDQNNICHILVVTVMKNVGEKKSTMSKALKLISVKYHLGFRTERVQPQVVLQHQTILALHLDQSNYTGHRLYLTDRNAHLDHTAGRGHLNQIPGKILKGHMDLKPDTIHMDHMDQDLVARLDPVHLKVL